MNRINKSDYSTIKKEIRQKIAEKEDIQIKDVEMITFPQNMKLQFSEEDKIYLPIKDRLYDNNKAYLIVNSEKDYIEYYNRLKDTNIIILKEDNTNYSYIFKEILYSKVVFTNLVHWAFIANLHKIPLIHWNSEVSRFKEEGIWHFNNKKSYCFPIDITENDDTFYNKIVKLITR